MTRRVAMSTTHLMWNVALGGHAWVFLNWALGLQAVGCEVVLLEQLKIAEDAEPGDVVTGLTRFRDSLRALGLEPQLAYLASAEQHERLREVQAELDAVASPVEELAPTCDLLLNFRYALPAEAIGRFARSALVDIDPGLLQCWIDGGHVAPAAHDLYFSIGETVGKPRAVFPAAGIDWIYTPPPVHLESWPVAAAAAEAPFTTVTNWWGEYELLLGKSVNNEKRTAFLECLDLPEAVRPTELELAVFHQPGHPSEFDMLHGHGWRARPAYEVSATAEAYRDYIQSSRGEFSCAKRSCIVLQNAWISDRTICYLASGKPAVVEYTGASEFLPDVLGQGLVRFRDADEAARGVRAVQSDYGAHSVAARELAERHFSAEVVLPPLLDRALEES